MMLNSVLESQGERGIQEKKDGVSFMNIVDIKYQFPYTPCIRNLLLPIRNIFET